MVFANWGLVERNSRAFCFIVSEVIVFCLYITDQATIGATIGTIVNLKWKLCSCFGKFVKLFFQNVSFVVKLVDKCQVGSSNVRLALQISDWLFSLLSRFFSGILRFSQLVDSAP